MSAKKIWIRLRVFQNKISKQNFRRIRCISLHQTASILTALSRDCDSTKFPFFDRFQTHQNYIYAHSKYARIKNGLDDFSLIYG